MRDVNEGGDKAEWLILRGWGVLATNWPMYFGDCRVAVNNSKQAKNGLQSWTSQNGIHGLYWILMDYHELSWTILDYPRLDFHNLGTYGLTYFLTDIGTC